MATLVITVVGEDRSGLVSAVADVVGAHGANWENSALAELAGAFAGVIELSVADDRVEPLRAALAALDGLLTVTVHPGSRETSDSGVSANPARQLTLQVIGNDHPGIVREVSAVLHAHGMSIERMSTETRDAAMSGGRLFEATVVAGLPASVDLADVTADLERIASEIQVDVTLTE